MEIYILNGTEVTLDQLQGAARAAGIPLEEFKVLNNVTLKPTEPDQEIQAEEDFQTGVADEDAYVAPEKYPGASELELKLEELSSDLPTNPRLLGRRKSEIRVVQNNLQNIYDSSPLDFDEPRTILRKGEDEVKTKLKQKYPWLVTESTGVGNALKNPITGELYKAGDTIYLQRTEKSRVVGVESNNGKSKTESQEYFSSIADQLKKGDLNLFNAITPTPGGKTFYKKFSAQGNNPEGIYEVDKEGLQTGTKPVDEAVVLSVYANYSK